MSVLKKMMLLEKEAEDFGFAWPDVSCILKQIQDECHEIHDAISTNESQERIQEEIGDLLHAALSLCCFMNFSPEETIEKTTAKFSSRFERLKTIALAEGHPDLKGQNFDTLMAIWQKAKEAS